MRQRSRGMQNLCEPRLSAAEVTTVVVESRSGIGHLDGAGGGTHSLEQGLSRVYWTSSVFLELFLV